MSDFISVDIATLEALLFCYEKYSGKRPLHRAYFAIRKALDTEHERRCTKPTLSNDDYRFTQEYPSKDQNGPECLECTAPATNGLYCAEHAPHGKEAQP